MKDLPKVGDIVNVVVRSQHPFGVFVDMDGYYNSLIEIFHFSDAFIPRKESNMPPTGRKLRAVVLGRRKSGQYELSLRKSDFAGFGHEEEWQDWEA